MKDVVDYEGVYMISEEGEIISLKRNRRISPFHKKGVNGERSYLRASLSKDGRKKKFFVHRLVANAYLGSPISEAFFVNHKDGNKLNNHFSNLEWVTMSENQIHAVKNGLRRGYNGTMQKRNTSGYVGVTKSGNKWKAQIRIKNKLIYLGLHDTPKQASIRYNEYMNSIA